MRMKKVELYLLLSGGNVALSMAFWKFGGVFFAVSLFAGKVPAVIDVLQFQESSATQNCLLSFIALE